LENDHQTAARPESDAKQHGRSGLKFAHCLSPLLIHIFSPFPWNFRFLMTYRVLAEFFATNNDIISDDPFG
jgi:hypothetical protein